jgi:hypothetical protein
VSLRRLRPSESDEAGVTWEAWDASAGHRVLVWVPTVGEERVSAPFTLLLEDLLPLPPDPAFVAWIAAAVAAAGEGAGPGRIVCREGRWEVFRTGAGPSVEAGIVALLPLLDPEDELGLAVSSPGGWTAVLATWLAGQRHALVRRQAALGRLDRVGRLRRLAARLAAAGRPPPDVQALGGYVVSSDGQRVTVRRGGDEFEVPGDPRLARLVARLGGGTALGRWCAAALQLRTDRRLLSR